jgi:hypothetical protein
VRGPAPRPDEADPEYRKTVEDLARLVSKLPGRLGQKVRIVAEVADYMEIVMTGEKAAGLKVFEDSQAVRRDPLPVRRPVRSLAR